MSQVHAEATAEPLTKNNPRKSIVSTGTIFQPIKEYKPTRRATRQNAEKIRQQVYLSHMEPMLQEVFEALRQGVRSGSAASIKMAAEVLQLVAKQGPAVAVQVNNQNNSRIESSAQQSATSIDAMIRRLDERDLKQASSQDFIDV